jgi:hypothetical protein
MSYNEFFEFCLDLHASNIPWSTQMTNQMFNQLLSLHSKLTIDYHLTISKRYKYVMNLLNLLFQQPHPPPPPFNQHNALDIHKVNLYSW